MTEIRLRYMENPTESDSMYVMYLKTNQEFSKR